MERVTSNQGSQESNHISRIIIIIIIITKKSAKKTILCKSEQKGKFLAACAEYVPINQHLSDAEDDLWVDLALRKYRDQQCAKLFQDFREIWEKCRRACDDKSSDVGRYSKLYNEHVKEKIHIFGIKPDQNMSLKNHVEVVKVVAVLTDLTVLFFTVFVPFLLILCLCCWLLCWLLVAEEQGSSR